jgi:hypothetical protein
MTLLSLFQWCEDTSMGTTIRESMWAFPVIESFHLIALAVIGGVVDLRLMGLLLRAQPVEQLADDMFPWMVGSLCVMILTGAALFCSEAVKCYYSTPFWFKMTSLLLAVTFTFTVRRDATTVSGWKVYRDRRKLIAVISLLLWLGVGIGGRAIGFY